MKFKLFIVALACLLCGATVNAQNQSVNNTIIIELLQEGFSADEIIGYIETASNRDISMGLNEMRALKNAGADTRLIQYLQKIAKTDFGYEGVLWWNTGEKPKKLYRCALEKEENEFGGKVIGAVAGYAGARLSNTTSGVVGSVVSGTLIASSAADFQKLIVQGASAKVVLTGENASNPVFRFYFPKNETSSSFDKTGDAWYMHVMKDIESPNEFQCVKMQQRKNKRIFPNGVTYSAAGFKTSGGGSRNIVDFEINEINNNTFEVTFPNGLEPGEYMFFYKNGLSNRYFQEHPFGFDFSVQ